MKEYSCAKKNIHRLALACALCGGTAGGMSLDIGTGIGALACEGYVLQIDGGEDHPMHLWLLADDRISLPCTSWHAAASLGPTVVGSRA